MEKLPDKLIVVGMRYVTGAQDFLNRLSKPYSTVEVGLHPVVNDKATGGTAYEVRLNKTKIGYVREADLPALKYALTTKTSQVSFASTKEYELTQVCANYLVLKLRKKGQVNPDWLPTEGMTTVLPGQNNFEVNPCKELYIKTEQQNIQIREEENMFDKLVANNKAVAVNAGYMEAGRIANNQVTKLVAAKAPLMVKGYIDTPVGKVVLANLTAMAVERFRPTDVRLKKVSVAMMTQAYQELIQTVDIEGMLNELTSSDGIKAALAAVAVNDEVKA